MARRLPLSVPRARRLSRPLVAVAVLGLAGLGLVGACSHGDSAEPDLGTTTLVCCITFVMLAIERWSCEFSSQST